MKTDTTQEATDKGAKEGGNIPHLTTVDETASGPSAGVQQTIPTNQSSMTDTAQPQPSTTTPPSTAASQTAGSPLNTSTRVDSSEVAALPSTPTLSPTSNGSVPSTPTTTVLTTTTNVPGSPKKNHQSVLSAKHLHLKWSSDKEPTQITLFEVHSKGVLTEQEMIGVLISAGWAEEHPKPKHPSYVNYFSTLPGLMWNSPNHERIGSVKMIIPLVIADNTKESVARALMDGQFLVKVPSKTQTHGKKKCADDPNYMYLPAKKYKPAVNTAEDKGGTEYDDENLAMSPKNAKDDGGGNSDVSKNAKEDKTKDDGGGDSAVTSKNTKDKTKEDDDGTELSKNHSGTESEEEGEEDGEEDGEDEQTSLKTEFGDTQYEDANTKGRRLTSRKNKSLTEPVWTDAHCSSKYKCNWDDCLLVFGTFHEHNWPETSYQFQEFWFSVGKKELESKIGTFAGGADLQKCLEKCYSFMTQVTKKDYTDMVDWRENYRTALDAKKNAQDDDDDVLVLESSETTSTMTKSQYEKGRSKMFLKFIREGNEKAKTAPTGKRDEMSLASVNDYQRFGTLKQNGEANVNQSLHNAACLLLTEYSYHYKDETTDPNYNRGLNFYTPEGDLWIAKSKRTVKNVHKLVDYRTKMPFGTDPTKNKDLGNPTLNQLVCGNPYFKLNYLPRGQDDCPLVLRNLLPSQGGPPIDYTLRECVMCGLHDPRDGGFCEDPNHHDGCGRHLIDGDLVIPWGEDIRLVRGDTLEIGVWTIDYVNFALICRVGIVKCAPYQLDMFQNRIGVVASIHRPEEADERECLSYEYMHQRLSCMENLIAKREQDHPKVEGGTKKRGKIGASSTAKEHEGNATITKCMKKWVEDRRQVNKKKGIKGKKKKTAVDIRYLEAVDGWAKVFFTDGMVDLKTAGALVDKK